MKYHKLTAQFIKGYHKKLFLIVFAWMVWGSLYAQKPLRQSFPDVLNLKQHITGIRNIEKSVFSDMGAWHAYALPSEKVDYGSFIGPMVMDLDGKWLAATLAKLELREDGKLIDLSAAKATQHYYPGLLEQSFLINGVEVKQQLIFVSGREAMQRTRIINHSKLVKSLSVSFNGNILLDGLLQKTASGVVFHQTQKENYFTLAFQQKATITVAEKSYHADFGKVKIAPGKSIDFVQVQSYFLQTKELATNASKTDFATALKQNELRWNGYLQSYFSKTQALDSDKSRLAVKAMVTLMTNWRSAAKDILHDGVFPSVNYQGFYGVWSWDSWKQAVGLSQFNISLAKDNIRCMFDYMDEHGMIVDCIYTDKSENNWRDTKPPLAAWAVWKVYEQSKDAEFVKELYPKLVKYHKWWYENRDHDKNNLCEYGSTDGTRIAAAWESGMDNAVRFDSAVMVKNNDHAWSLNQESVDLNAYLFAEKSYLSKLALVLGKKAEAEVWEKQTDGLAAIINKQFFDETKGYYYDKLFNKNERITVEGTEGWIPLWAGIATDDQAKAVMNVMKNKNKFNTKVPLPTFTADHAKFDPQNGYWRGPVWLDQFYFGIIGLKKYGYNKLADEMLNKLFNNAEGLLGDAPIHETYHPITGKGLNAYNFSWSAAHLLMMLEN